MYCLIWTLKKCVVLFGSKSLKLSMLFDIKSEKVSTIVDSNYVKVWILFCFFGQMIYYGML